MNERRMDEREYRRFTVALNLWATVAAILLVGLTALSLSLAIPATLQLFQTGNMLAVLRLILLLATLLVILLFALLGIRYRSDPARVLFGAVVSITMICILTLLPYLRSFVG